MQNYLWNSHKILNFATMMKNFLLNLSTALFCAVTLSILTSCVNEDNPSTTPAPDPAPLADVTIMYYAHGGGNLDHYMVGNLRRMYKAELSSYNNVKIVAECKFSGRIGIPDMTKKGNQEILAEDLKKYGEEAEEKLSDWRYIFWMAPEAYSTFRIVIDPTKTLREQVEGHYLPGENADITAPDSLTNFINWAAKTCPAKKYVLILHDHGLGYRPDTDLYNENGKPSATRYLMIDNGHPGHHFSAPSLAHAIKAADIRPNVVIFDACLMNTMEYMFEMKDLTDYIVASTYVNYAGPPYDTFIGCMSAASDHLKYALEKYIEYNAKHFDKLANEAKMDVFYYDITVTETARLDALGKALREFTDRLCNTYKNGTANQRQRIDDVTKYAVKIHKGNPSYDIGRYIEGMSVALPEVFDDAFWADMEEAFNGCIAGQYASKYLLDHDYQVDYSVLLAIKGAYQCTSWRSGSHPQAKELVGMTYYYPDGKMVEYGVSNGEFEADVMPDFKLRFVEEDQWGGTLESVYGALAFDKAIGWSRWLLLNEQQPALWCNNDFFTPLPDLDDLDSTDPIE